MAFESLIFESLPLGNLPAAFNHLGGWNWGGGGGPDLDLFFRDGLMQTAVTYRPNFEA